MTSNIPNSSALSIDTFFIRVGLASAQACQYRGGIQMEYTLDFTKINNVSTKPESYRILKYIAQPKAKLEASQKL